MGLLTDRECKTAQPSAKPRKISDSLGLYLEIMPNGSKYWRFKYRFLGKEKRLALGVYPEVSLLKAREKRDQARALLAENIDPGQARKEARLDMARKADITFERVAREWHQLYQDRWSKSHAQTIIHRLEMDIFTQIGKRPIGEITAPEMLACVRKIENRGAHEMARRAVQIAGQVFRYAIVTGQAPHNPAADLKGALKPFRKGHFATLEIRQVPDFLQKLEHNNARLYPETRLAIKLLMLTFVRTGELIGATWDEFDLDQALWIIPAERMKMRTAHIVPLSKQALEILCELKERAGTREHILPSQINPRKHMSNNTILKALERMGYKGEMTGHGFRALAMTTIKEKLNYRHEVVDRQLAHAPRNKVDAAYDRAQFLEQRVRMMQEWADYLDRLAQNATVISTPFGRTDHPQHREYSTN